MEILTIDCGGCSNRGLACSDCAVSALLGLRQGEAPRLTVEERSAVAALAGQGLVPPLRHEPMALPRAA